MSQTEIVNGFLCVDGKIICQYLYHGTDSERFQKIQKEGIKPNTNLQKVWEHLSKPNSIYLTTSRSLAERFAESAKRTSKDPSTQPIVLRVHVSTLEKSKVFVDENCAINFLSFRVEDITIKKFEEVK